MTRYQQFDVRSLGKKVVTTSRGKRIVVPIPPIYLQMDGRAKVAFEPSFLYEFELWWDLKAHRKIPTRDIRTGDIANIADFNTSERCKIRCVQSNAMCTTFEVVNRKWLPTAIRKAIK